MLKFIYRCNFIEAAENPQESFSIDARKGMPIHLLPQQNKNEEEEYYEEEYYEEGNDEYGEEGTVSSQESVSSPQKQSVLNQALLPERPPNWERYCNVFKC